MLETRVRVGVIGCGVVSNDYFSILTQFSLLDVIACADLDRERAEARAATYHIPRVCTPEELLDDQEIDLVVNLTTPAVHAEIGLAALQAGKSLYTEKPLAVHRADARQLLDLARDRDILVGCAPDTFLGSPLQTCRQLIDEGLIGQPLAFNACMQTRGPEHYHPEPAYYYQPGAGPLFDMGPYYLTTLVHLLGPVRRVAGLEQQACSERTITSFPHRGTSIVVAVSTRVNGLLQFASGVVGTLTTSFDVWASEIPAIEIYGTEGTVSIPDPSFFAGPIRLQKRGEETWRTIPLFPHPYRDGRGLGVADLASALRSGRSPRAGGELAYHVLDIMHAFHEADQQGRYIDLESFCDRPTPLVPEELL